jgi:hypothetical protein
MWINWIVRTGSAPFSFFLIWLSTGNWLLLRGERWGESYPRFPSDFGDHSLTLCFWFWSTRSLGFGRPAGAEDCSLESLRSYADLWVCSRAKTGLVLGDFEILFGFRSPIHRALGWHVFFRYVFCVDVGIGWTGAEAVSFRI